MHKRRLSEEIYEQLSEVIPGGANSPIRACRAMKQTPMTVESGAGDEVFDVDGQSFIDYCGSWGVLIHGHAHPQIIEAAGRRMAKGTTFGISTAIEEKLARKVVNVIDSIDKIRFVSSGTEATMSAVRLARGYTGKEYFIKFIGHYHGHADHFLVQAGSGLAGLTPTSSSSGVPKEIVKQTICIPFNDIDACQRIFSDPMYKDNLAAVILEPIAGNMGVVPANPEFIQFLRKETEKIGTLLIFDEVITGFRVGYTGAQGLYKIKPDLTTLGKIVGGGFPAAAFGGRQEIMDKLAPLGTVYQAGTLSGNPIAMEAGLQALTLLESEGFYEELERKTKLLINPIKDYIKERNIPACIQDVGSMFTLFFGQTKVENMDDVKKLDTDKFAQFFRYMFEHGVYLPPLQVEPWFISMAHTDEHLIKTRELVLAFLEKHRQ